MASMRVHELAKEFDMSSGDLLDRLKEMKIPAKSHASMLNEAYVDKIRKNLEPEIRARAGALAASPDVMRFDCQGQSARLLPVNAEGVYAVSYASDRPEVAAVDGATGLVTAVGPGEAVITPHFEGNGENRDFTCAVACRWQPRLP